MEKQYVISVNKYFREAKGYYKCEHAGIIFVEQQSENATIVGVEYLPWLKNVIEYLMKYYNMLEFEIETIE
jgi:uncharacterized alpha/beta hydrolase family protein